MEKKNQIQAKKRETEWAAQQAEWDAEHAKAELEKPSPFVEEIIRLEGAIKFCEGKRKVETLSIRFCGDRKAKSI
jgi:hypothetical protein